MTSSSGGLKKATLLTQATSLLGYVLDAYLKNPDWKACLKVLKNCELELSSVDIWLRKFCEMLPSQTAMVVGCFEKLTYRIRNSNAQ